MKNIWLLAVVLLTLILCGCLESETSSNTSEEELTTFMIRTDPIHTDMLFVFDLASAETYLKRKGKNGSRAAFYPEEWKNQFGVSVKDHQDLTLVSIFFFYTVFKIEKGEDGKERVSDGNNFIGHEEKTDSCVQENVNGD